MYVGNVKTLTILITGEKDLRTPMAQTEEYAGDRLEGPSDPDRLSQYRIVTRTASTGSAS